MKINLFYFALAGATVATIGVGFTLAQAVDPRIARFEQGPATIDVSK